MVAQRYVTPHGVLTREAREGPAFFGGALIAVFFTRVSSARERIVVFFTYNDQYVFLHTIVVMFSAYAPDVAGTLSCVINLIKLCCARSVSTGEHSTMPTRKYVPKRGAGRRFTATAATAATRIARQAAREAVAAMPARGQGSMRRYGGTAGSAIGAKLGGPVGAKIGKVLGRGAGGLFSRILGKGAYTVRTNTITNPSSYTMDGIDQVPLMHNDAGTTRIRHREYVTDVFSTEDFTNITYDIQPTNSQLFPWLAAAAQNYEQHKWLGLVFEFKSLSANALTSANTGLGSVSLATQYNALNTPFVNKQELLNYQFASSVKPSDSMLHPVECDPNQTPNQPLYMRIGSQADGDARLFNIGTLNLVTQGMQSDGATIGELWVTYDLLCIKPRISSGLGLGLRSAFYKYTSTADWGQYIGDACPLGATAVAKFDSIGMDFEYKEVSAGNLSCKFTFPLGSEGLYLVQNTYFGNGVAFGANLQSIGTVVYTNVDIRTTLYNVTPVNPGGTSNVGINVAAQNTTQFSMDNIVSIPDPNKLASIEYVANTGWAMGNGSSADFSEAGNLLICQLNNLVAPAAAASALAGHFGYNRKMGERKEEEPELQLKNPGRVQMKYFPAPPGEDDAEDDGTYEEVMDPPPLAAVQRPIRKEGRQRPV